MTVLFALAPATGLARQDNQDAAHAEAIACVPHNSEALEVRRA